VALELDTSQSLPENFLAILHVPILSASARQFEAGLVRPSSEGALRVGCLFHFLTQLKSAVLTFFPSYRIIMVCLCDLATWL